MWYEAENMGALSENQNYYQRFAIVWLVSLYTVRGADLLILFFKNFGDPKS